MKKIDFNAPATKRSGLITLIILFAVVAAAIIGTIAYSSSVSEKFSGVEDINLKQDSILSVLQENDYGIGVDLIRHEKEIDSLKLELKKLQGSNYSASLNINNLRSDVQDLNDRVIILERNKTQVIVTPPNNPQVGGDDDDEDEDEEEDEEDEEDEEEEDEEDEEDEDE